MNACAANAKRTDAATPKEIAILRRLRVAASSLRAHLSHAHRTDARARTLLARWDGEVHLGADPMRATFESGCLVVGCSEAARDGVLEARMLLALSSAYPDKSRCRALNGWLVQVAQAELGWTVAVDCHTCMAHGMCSTLARCHLDKRLWQELVGTPLSSAVKTITRSRPGTRVLTSTWDVVHTSPGAPGTVRVTYDARTGLVTNPPPYLTLLPEPTGTTRGESCFLDVRGAGECVGAPAALRPNPDWDQMVGQFWDEAVMRLRRRYPAAVVVAWPSDAAVSEDLRYDRIRVFYDRSTQQVDRVPIVG